MTLEASQRARSEKSRKLQQAVLVLKISKSVMIFHSVRSQGHDVWPGGLVWAEMLVVLCIALAAQSERLPGLV